MDRLAFKFYKSYFDVGLELNDKDRLAFYDALLNKQFLGVDPNLKGIQKLAYISQKHNIDLQVKGWEDKTKLSLNKPPALGGKVGGKVECSVHPKAEEKEKEKEKEKEEVKEKSFYKKFNHLFISFQDFEKLNIDYEKETIDDVLNKIQNYKKNTNYVSLYLTALTWLKKEPKKEIKMSNQPLKMQY